MVAYVKCVLLRLGVGTLIQKMVQRHRLPKPTFISSRKGAVAACVTSIAPYFGYGWRSQYSCGIDKGAVPRFRFLAHICPEAAWAWRAWRVDLRAI